MYSYSCNDCNGWDDSTSSTISSNPSQICCCSNDCSGGNGSFQNYGNSFGGGGGGGCGCNNEGMAEDNNSPCDQNQYRQPVKESALSRRKRYQMQRSQMRRRLIMSIADPCLNIPI